MAETVEICGYVSNVVFHNEENGYTVLTLEQPDEEEITVVGTFVELSPGEYMRIEGEMINHAVYGEQLKAQSYEFVMPSDTESAERYLASGVIKGIGPAMAKRIVKTFGADVFEILEHRPEELCKVKGISEIKARMITKAVVEKREVRNATMFLQKYGIGTNLAVKIYEYFGDDTYSVIKNNPYRLADEINGVGFKTADEIAMSSGIAPESDFRIKCGVVYALTQALSAGHTCLPYEEMIRAAAEVLDLYEEQIEPLIADMVMEHRLVIKRSGEETYAYASPYYYMELNVAKGLCDLNVSGEFDEVKLRREIEAVEKRQGIILDEIQRYAVEAAMTHGLLIITGGPGTGKTTTINTLIGMLEEADLEVVLAAPTGRAARRMKEATGHEACTIHRLLEVAGGPVVREDGGSGLFGRNEENPLEADVVIVDEASMIDITLMNALVKALAIGTRLILVGDVNQLPSVGPGNVLKDMIESEAFPVVRLNRIFRQAQESDIVLNAHAIKEGNPIDVDKRSRDFLFVKRPSADHIIAAMLTLVKEKLPGYVGAEIYDVQVLTPMRKGVLGVENLNRILQQYLNPPEDGKEEKHIGEVIFREGDKVMQIKNDYQLEWEVTNAYHVVLLKGLGVFNGDCGIIRQINQFTEELIVEYDEGRTVRYPFALADELDLAYATTIHKAQGSEFPAVVIPLLSGPPMLMTRNLIYTAITRAKTCVTIVGSTQTFLEMAANANEQRRYSGLANRIREICREDF